MLPKILKGKRSIVNVIASSPDLQKKMRLANNCKSAGYWGCGNCTIPRLARCFEKVRHDITFEAFKEYKDNPKYKKQQEEIEKELKKSNKDVIM